MSGQVLSDVLQSAKSMNTDQALEIAGSLCAMIEKSGGDIEVADPKELAKLAQISMNTCWHLLTYIETIQATAKKTEH